MLLLAVVLLLLAEAGHPPGSWASTGYLMLAAFGSTMPYMLSWPTPYVEAISWAVTFSAASLYCLIRGWLTAACVLAMLAFFTRVNTGASAMFAVGVIALFERNRRVLVMLAVSACFFVTYNHARFGTYLDGLPVHLHVQYDTARLARLGGTLFHPGQAYAMLADYLFQPPQFRASFPWLEYRPGTLMPLRWLDLMDHHTGALPIMPALAWLSMGAWFGETRRRVRWILLAPLIGVVLLSCMASFSHRYLHEFALLFLPAGVYGLRWAMAARWRLWVTVVLSVWSIYACGAIALVAQGEVSPWIPQEAMDRHRAVQFRVDRWIGGGGNSAIEVDYMKGAIAPRVEGLEVRLLPAGARYRFDGARWVQLEGPPVHRFQTKVAYEKLPEAIATDVLRAGTGEDSDAVVLRRVSPGRYSVCVDHYRTKIECGAEIALEVRREYVFDSEMDRMNREVRVKLDGVPVVTRHTPLWNWIAP
jgi:hypothetical protein